MRTFGGKRTALALVLVVLAVVVAGAVAVPRATGAWEVFAVIGDIAGEPQYHCNDAGCDPIVVGYTYDGSATCRGGCLGWPQDPTETRLSFSVTRAFSNDPCRMKNGTGTLDLSWPSDAGAPSARGTLTFKARDSHSVAFNGAISSSTTSALAVNEPLKGYVTFPPNPCVGGAASVSIAFG